MCHKVAVSAWVHSGWWLLLVSNPGSCTSPDACCARGGNIVLMVFRGYSGHFPETGR